MSFCPKISVIVPVYNVERVLERAINSILQQSYKDFEVLLINDGSTDKSGEICNTYLNKDSRIRVFHQQNQGVSAARNLGLKMSCGEYIIFIDSDDVVDVDFFSLLVPYMNEYDMIFWGMRNVTDKKNLKTGYRPEDMDSKVVALSEIVYSLIKIGLLGYTCTMCIRRSIICDHNLFFDQTVCVHEDTLFCYDCLMYAKHIRSLSIQPYVYYIYSSGLSSKTPDNYGMIALKRINKLEKLLVVLGISSSKRKELISLLKYWTYSRCVDKAYSSPQKYKNLSQVFKDLKFAEDFHPYSIQERFFKLAVSLKSPSLLILGKKILRILGR